MRKHLVLGSCLISVFLPLLASRTAHAQAAVPGAETSIAAELSKLNASLAEIATLLRQQTRDSETGLLIKRLELAERRLTESEQAVKAAEGDLRQAQQEKDQFEMQIALYSKTEAAEQDEASTPSENRPPRAFSSESLGVLRDEVVQMVKRSKDRIAKLAFEIEDLRGTVQVRRDEVQNWQGILDRRLRAQ